jgi:hypothetical protein
LTVVAREGSSNNQIILAKFEVLTAVVMNVAIFWDIALCNPYVNRRFGRKYNFYLQGLKSINQLAAGG